ncbi:hypothetical protein SEVIR_5G430166v4 [Setaria viridis]
MLTNLLSPWLIHYLVRWLLSALAVARYVDAEKSALALEVLDQSPHHAAPWPAGTILAAEWSLSNSPCLQCRRCLPCYQNEIHATVAN